MRTCLEKTGIMMRLRANKYLLAAKDCLALGQIEEALLALSRIPFYARNHPEFRRIKGVLAAILPQITEAILHPPGSDAKFK